jgi:DNA repair exonuclease SbcCD ATPase subunit
MKRVSVLGLYITLILFSTLPSFAQSDYEMVQSFKERYQQISQGIKAASSLEELNNLSAEIENLKRDFSARKEILDKSLYPDNFTSSIEKLSASIETRSTDFTEIVGLQTEVTTLKSEIDLLNRRNNELINQISELETQRKKDAATISKLENLVANLRAIVQKRDELIYGIIDSLMPKLSGDVSTMTQQDKEQVYSQIEKNNVLAVVKKSLRDNSRFLNVTSLNAKDLEEIKKQQQNFASMWNKIGPKLVAVYANKKEKVSELRDIDNLYVAWVNNIRQEAWESIREEFSINNINLQSFSNGNEFTNVINQFITDEINSYPVKNKAESEKIYTVFADSVWYKSINPDWMPYLLENNLLTKEQKDVIEKKISEWKSVVYPTDLTWLYGLIALIVIVGAIIFFMKKKKVSTAPPPQPPTTPANS